MTSPRRIPPGDPELDQLLAGQVRRTRPEFEQRWRDLRHTLVPGRRSRRWQWYVWPVLTAAAVAMLVIRLERRPTAPTLDGPLSAPDLIALNDALVPAQPLLEPETRDAVLHLPVQTK